MIRTSFINIKNHTGYNFPFLNLIDTRKRDHGRRHLKRFYNSFIWQQLLQLFFLTLDISVRKAILGEVPDMIQLDTKKGIRCAINMHEIDVRFFFLISIPARRFMSVSTGNI